MSGEDREKDVGRWWLAEIVTDLSHKDYDLACDGMFRSCIMREACKSAEQ